MSDFAVIKTGGKQYVVSEGDVISIEKLPGEFKAGDKITFEEVIMTDNGKDTMLGAPFVKGAKVTGELLEMGRGKKVEVVKYKAKSRYLKRRGHRQPYFKVKISTLK